MRDFLILLLSLIPLLPPATATAVFIVKFEPTQGDHANHVFNAILSSTRQRGSTLNHNGMSFFLASISMNTKLYHRTSTLDAVEGMDWLAFEPEVAHILERDRWEVPKTKPGDGSQHGQRLESKQGEGRAELRKHRREEQVPLVDNMSPPNVALADTSYLHTYIPTRPLRLLYIDGLSVAMTQNSTLDTQDMLLLEDCTSPELCFPTASDAEQVHKMCELTTTLWDNKVDGFLRVNSSLEITLCKFEGRVKRVSVETLSGERRGQPRSGEKEPEGSMGWWSHTKAVSEQYHGVGREKVVLDYENFVSVFAYGQKGELGLWKYDVMSGTPQPRLISASPTQLKKIRDAVTDMILHGNEKEKEEETIDWPTIADKVVKQYATALHYVHTDASIRSSKKHLASYLGVLLEPFVIPSQRDTILETERCIAQFVPPLPPHSTFSTARTAIYSVTSHICSTLITAFDDLTLAPSLSLAALSSPPYRALDLIDTLVRYLQWAA